MPAQQSALGPFGILEVYEQASKYGDTISVLTMSNLHGVLAHTYVDSANKNYRFWKDIIDLHDQGYGVVIDDLYYKVKDGEIQQKYIRSWDRYEPLINADSRPRIVHTYADQQMVLDRLAEELV